MPQAPQFPTPALPVELSAAKLLGLYPQRQTGLWMQRVRVLGGRLEGRQWKALAGIARRYTAGTPLRLTTRQDVELHDLKADQVNAVQAALAEAGLTCLGTGGDTVRNLTVCPCAGLRPGSVELIGLAEAIASMVSAESDIFALPRKFKIALSCGLNCGQPYVNDLGLSVVQHDGRRSFRVTAGGSLGPRPGTAMVLYEQLEAEAAIPLAWAAIRVFAEHGDRTTRARARLRHVRQKIGDTAFAMLLRLRLEEARAARPWPRVELAEPARLMPAERVLVFRDGDLEPDAADRLGELVEGSNLIARIDTHHSVRLFAASETVLDEALTASPVLRPAARQEPRVIACPGNRWCARALGDTRAMARRLRKSLGEQAAGLRVCVSGCPNGCSQSAVADIGLICTRAADSNQQGERWNVMTGGGLGRDDRLACVVAEKATAEEAVQAASRR